MIPYECRVGNRAVRRTAEVPEIPQPSRIGGDVTADHAGALGPQVERHDVAFLPQPRVQLLQDAALHTQRSRESAPRPSGPV